MPFGFIHSLPLFWDIHRDVLNEIVIEKINRMQIELLWLPAKEGQW